MPTNLSPEQLYAAMPSHAKRIVEKVSNSYGVPIEKIMNTRVRSLDVVEARRKALDTLKELPSDMWPGKFRYSPNRIGAMWGSDHTLVTLSARKYKLQQYRIRKRLLKKEADNVSGKKVA